MALKHPPWVHTPWRIIPKLNELTDEANKKAKRCRAAELLIALKHPGCGFKPAPRNKPNTGINQQHMRPHGVVQSFLHHETNLWDSDGILRDY